MGSGNHTKALVLVAVAASFFVMGQAYRPVADDAVVIAGFVVRGTRQLDSASLRSLKQQIALVNSLAISPTAKDFFHSQPIRIDRTLAEPGRNDANGVTLDGNVHPADNPILLHELLHIFHRKALPGGFENRAVVDAFHAARNRGAWPANSYMLSNRREFFAMTASAVLHGRVGRPPRNRENVARRMPVYYDWLKATFQLKDSEVSHQ